jgi:hypothetical protein
MTPQTCTVTIDMNLGATTDDQRYGAVPFSGEWELVSACYVPATSVTQDDTDYRTFTIKQGSITLATFNTKATGGYALTAGTPKAFDLATGSGGKNLEFTGLTDGVTCDSTHSGSSGKVGDGAFVIGFRKLG